MNTDETTRAAQEKRRKAKHPPSVIGYVDLTTDMDTILDKFQVICGIARRIALLKHREDGVREVRLLIQTVERDDETEESNA